MNIDDNLKIIKLIDVYGSLLTSKKYQIVVSYYFDNLTLSEIGDNYGISRQAVNDSISSSVKTLKAYEEKLGWVAREASIVDKLLNLSNSTDDKVLKGNVQEIIDEIRG